MNIEFAAVSPESTLYAVPARRPHLRMVSAGIFWTIVVVNAAVIVWLWIYGKNISGVHGWGDLWTSIGRLSGLLSAYLALIQVLLLARLPWLERVLGFDRLTVWHRLNGKICLYLVLAHVVFITIGYAAMDQVGIPTEVSRLLADYPGMVAATVGTAVMIGVVITSLVIVRRRLPYEFWYAVHLLVYVGIALAWFHQIPTGNELTANATAANYWTSLYLATAALLLWFRVVVPTFQAFRYQMRVADVISEGPGVVSLRISGRQLERLDARAGQFFLWRFLTRDRWWSSHPFSLSAAPDNNSLRITVKGVGNFTRRIGEIRPGTRVIAEGPFGVFTDVVRSRNRVLFIAGGIGITPIRAMLEDMPGDLIFIYRVIREEDLVFRGELERLARERGITLHFVVGDHTRPEGRDLLSADHVRRLVPDLEDRDVYLCGPPMMMRIVEQNLHRAGVSQKYLHSERFVL
jgi:predicted ferric reductase